jgi:hypothetical protein
VIADIEYKRQRLAGQLVEREVQLCLSGWVDSLIKGSDGDRFDEEAWRHYYGDQGPDWDSVYESLSDYAVVFLADDETWRKGGPDGAPVQWANECPGHEPDPGSGAPMGVETFCDGSCRVVEHVTGAACSGEWYVCETDREGLPLLSTVEAGNGHSTFADAVEQAADCDRIDVHEHKAEIYEWWAVSGWFGRQLAERGEHVVDGEHGGSVWGRTCSGQTIALDCVVRSIAAATWPEEWNEQPAPPADAGGACSTT